MATSFQAQMPTTSSLFSAYASLSTLAMLLRSIFNEFIPRPVQKYFLDLFHYLVKPRSKKLTLVFEEVNPTGIGRNQVYDAAELYLSTKVANPSTDRLKISKSPKDKTFTIRFEKGELIDDEFDGVSLSWRFLCQESDKKRRVQNEDDSPSPASTHETKYFELSLEKEHKNKVIDSYLPYVLAKSKTLKEDKRSLKLCTLGSRFSPGNVYWDTINLEHPSTFDTLAMDPVEKADLKADLDRFVRRREFYKRVGRAWKRGYLLYGPPGTGKSSLVAAIANYLKFDVYDLQLGSLMRDSDLRRLLLSTANRSILVIEDIDCTVDIKNRKSEGRVNEYDAQIHKQQFPQTPPPVQLTLSGLLNFIDGLWSSCGDERIIVFTTNHRDKLDPALLRPGRMDKHIHMSYLTVPGFRQLASNYLATDRSHPLFDEIERLIETIEVTPAQVAEELMRSEEVDEALECVAKLLREIKETMVSKESSKGEVENGYIDSSGSMKDEDDIGHIGKMIASQNGAI